MILGVYFTIEIHIRLVDGYQRSVTAAAAAHR